MCERSPLEAGDIYFKDLKALRDSNAENPAVYHAYDMALSLFIKSHGRWDLTENLNKKVDNQ